MLSVIVFINTHYEQKVFSWWVSNAATFKNKQSISSHFFAPYILQSARLMKNSKKLIDNIFINTIVFCSYSGNLIFQILEHLLDCVILKYFLRKFQIKMTHMSVITNFSTMMSSKIFWKIFPGKISSAKIISWLAQPLMDFTPD